MSGDGISHAATGDRVDPPFVPVMEPEAFPIPVTPIPAGPTARVLYRIRAALGRRAVITWTLAVLWLAAAWARVAVALAGHVRGRSHRATLFLTLTMPQSMAGTLRHGRDRLLDHAARWMRTMPPPGMRRRLHRLRIATAVRVAYALDHQASRLTWRLARTLRALEREATVPFSPPAPLPRRPARVGGWLPRLGEAIWQGLERIARGADRAVTLAGRATTALHWASSAIAGRMLASSGALKSQWVTVLRRAGTQGAETGRRVEALAHRLAAQAAGRARALQPLLHPAQPHSAQPRPARPWLARWPRLGVIMPILANRTAQAGRRVRGGIWQGLITLRATGRAAWTSLTGSDLRRIPWRRLGGRLLVPAQCAACILFGLSLIRRGDMVHLLAGGLLVTAFVLMAIVYTWMQLHPPQAVTAAEPAAELAAQLAVDGLAVPATEAIAPTDSARADSAPADNPPADNPPEGNVPACEGPVAPVAGAPGDASEPAKPRRKRPRRKSGQSPVPVAAASVLTGT
ncbi:hypothetical protein [Azospirillum sp. B4]|uniref:hypothetical protein n=1 Tax=Azospirillum sp. B4 TaxID=95605 RepID=UPI0005CB227B|nr:hypothetical protein [Azospirillum sp. B4]